MKYLFAGALGLAVLSWVFSGVPWALYLGNWLYFLSLTQGLFAVLLLLWLLGMEGLDALLVPAGVLTLSFAPVALLFLLGLWGGQDRLFHWSGDEGHSLWLSGPFLFGRNLAALLLFYSVAARIVLNFLKNRKKHPALLITLLLLFLLNQCLVSWDFGMTLSPHWHNTLFAPYFGFGGLYAGLALLMFMLAASKESACQLPVWEPLRKLLLTFALVWVYLWGAQFVPTWYANLPEETGPLYRGLSGEYAFFSVLMVFLLFVIPFVVLLFGGGRKGTMKPVLGMILAGSWIERYLVVVPPVRQLNSAAAPSAWVSGLTTMGFFAVVLFFALLSVDWLKRQSSTTARPSPAN
ncbi:MAG: hypothetical protein ACE5F7_07325 [Nitrospiria bacterium]